MGSTTAEDQLRGCTAAEGKQAQAEAGHLQMAAGLRSKQQQQQLPPGSPQEQRIQDDDLQVGEKAAASVAPVVAYQVLHEDPSSSPEGPATPALPMHLSYYNTAAAMQHEAAHDHVAEGECLEAQPAGMEAPVTLETWWASYLASTLTGWSLHAAMACYCDTCSRRFTNGVSVLQHFRDSPRHFATVEAFEAYNSLYAYEAAHEATFGTAFSNYYYGGGNNAGAEVTVAAVAASTAGPKQSELGGGGAVGDSRGAVSPTQLSGAPSAIFAASSDASECGGVEHTAGGGTVEQERPAARGGGGGGAGGRRRVGRSGRGSGSHGARGLNSGGRGTRAGCVDGAPFVAAGSAPRAAKQAPPQAPPVIEDTDAFPSLGGATGTSAAPQMPPRRWGVGLSTRPLRVQAVTWAPGVDASVYSDAKRKSQAEAARVAAEGAAVAPAEQDARTEPEAPASSMAPVPAPAASGGCGGGSAVCRSPAKPACVAGGGAGSSDDRGGSGDAGQRQDAAGGADQCSVKTRAHTHCPSPSRAHQAAVPTVAAGVSWRAVVAKAAPTPAPTPTPTPDA